MSTLFFYEDGQEKIVDEEGHNAMDWEKVLHPDHPTTLTRIRLYCEAQVPKQSSADEGLDTKMEEVANEVKKQISIAANVLMNRNYIILMLRDGRCSFSSCCSHKIF